MPTPSREQGCRGAGSHVIGTTRLAAGKGRGRRGRRRMRPEGPQALDGPRRPHKGGLAAAKGAGRRRVQAWQAAIKPCAGAQGERAHRALHVPTRGLVRVRGPFICARARGASYACMPTRIYRQKNGKVPARFLLRAFGQNVRSVIVRSRLQTRRDGRRGGGGAQLYPMWRPESSRYVSRGGDCIANGA